MAATSYDQQLIYLYGDLELYIIEARRLPNVAAVSKHVRSLIALCNCRTTPSFAAESPEEDGHDSDGKLHQHRYVMTSDPYVTVQVPHATLARTRVMRNSANPKWKQHFNIPVAHPVTNLEFHVKDNDFFGAEHIGVTKIPAQNIASGELISGWFPIIGTSGKLPKPETAILLKLRFTPCEKSQLYQHGIAGDPNHQGVRNVYFPLRRGCHVTLYKDAHVRDHEVREIQIEDEEGKKMVYKQEKCWEHMCDAISEAHHLIYITGCSVHHKIKLVREPTRPLPRGGDLTLGESESSAVDLG